MESSGSRSETGEGGVVMLSKPTASRPTLTLPPRNPAETLLKSFDATTPSPMTFVSSLFAEQDPYADCKSFSQLLAGAMASPTAQLGEGFSDPGVPTNSAHINGASGMPTGGSFAERLAARGAGNKGPGGPASPGSVRSSTARFKSMTPSRLPIPRSTYLTIPPGLSPTTLLDSPVLLSTGQAEPSPTTGTFPLPPFLQESGSTERSSEQDGSPSFVFKPFPKLGRNPLSPLANMGPYGLSHQQALAQVQAQAQSHVSSSAPGAITAAASESLSAATAVSSFSAPKLVTPLQSKGPFESTERPLNETSERVQPAQPPVPALPPPHMVERPSEDGYNWRKYGQKQVKGSEYPRSYYKCTHPNCPVKKKVERSLDGQVTEIVYKGEHNHPKPQATRRLAMSAAHISDGGGREASHSMAVEKAETSNGVGKANGERSLVDPSSSKGQLAPFSGGLAGTPEPSSGSTSDDEGEDGEGSKAEDGGDDEPDSKRRKKEKSKEVTAMAPLRTIREPRVVVQTTSDVDILDDGYRWRKYGQKVVKGNPHPRSYYKCTNLGCSVRKHVERSSTDSKAVITTYEGKHNHDVPAARNSNHDTSGSAATAVRPPPGLAHGVSSVNTLTKPSPSLQDQFQLGKLLEDRFRAGDKMSVGMEMSSGGMVNGALASEQNRGQGGTDISAQTAMSLMSSGISGGRPLEGCEFFGQGLGLRPKEEPREGHPLGSSLQPIYPSSSSSFNAQRLLSGP